MLMLVAVLEVYTGRGGREGGLARRRKLIVL